MDIWVGSDHAGFELKNKLLTYLNVQYGKYHVNDLGCYTSTSCDYPDFAKSVCEKVKDHGGFGILVCGTGQGMCMTANRIPGIRAALVYNEDIARLTREHNNANVMCLGSKFIDDDDVWKCVEMFLNTEFSKEERHRRRINKI